MRSWFFIIMNNTFDFVAIDFETPFPPTTKPNYICQVGLVAVKNGEIVERFSSLVQPPNNVYDKKTSDFHGITPEMTADKPTWEQLWPQIRHFFEGQTLVAHNSRFETDILNFTADYYGIMLMGMKSIFCTCYAFSQASFKALSYGFGMPYDPDKHHDALYDAEGCAQFYLNYLNGIEPDWEKVAEKKKEKKVFPNKFVIREQLSGDVLKQDLTGADPNNPFYDRKVVITGEFTQKRNTLGKILKSMGADVNTTISKNTHFVLVGSDPGPKKIEKINKLEHDGFHIQVLYQHDLDAILNDDWSSYRTVKETIKDLDLTIEHYNKHHIKFDNNINIIASRELYYGKNLSGNLDVFKQICGNLGACGDNEIYPETNICIISDSTLEKLRKGEKDETILYIQDYYNKNKSVTFGLTFLSENEILEYCKQRCLACGDELTMEYYGKYIKSGTTNRKNQSTTIQEILNAESNYILPLFYMPNTCITSITTRINIGVNFSGERFISTPCPA